MNLSLAQFPAMNHDTPYYGDRQRQMIPFLVGVRVRVLVLMPTSDSVS